MMEALCEHEGCSLGFVEIGELYTVTIQHPERYLDREDISEEFTLTLCEEHVHDVLDMGPIPHKTNERDETAVTTRDGPGADDVVGGDGDGR